MDLSGKAREGQCSWCCVVTGGDGGTLEFGEGRELTVSSAASLVTTNSSAASLVTTNSSAASLVTTGSSAASLVLTASSAAS